MSQEKLEIVRRLVEAFNDRDDEALASMLDAEIEFESLTLQTYKGSDGLTEYRRYLDDAWAEWRTEGDRFLSAGSETVVHMHQSFICIGSYDGAMAATSQSRSTSRFFGRCERARSCMAGRCSTHRRFSTQQGWRSS
jgi:hypothetical protein